MIRSARWAHAAMVFAIVASIVCFGRSSWVAYHHGDAADILALAGFLWGVNAVMFRKDYIKATTKGDAR